MTTRQIYLSRAALIGQYGDRAAQAVGVILDAESISPEQQAVIGWNIRKAVQAATDLAVSVVAREKLGPVETPNDAVKLLESAGAISASTEINMRKAISMRNILVHEHINIDWSIVLADANDHIGNLRTFAREVLDHYGLLPADECSSRPGAEQ
jgi:uncharacterized protein YutE (UPF0331/DUF86 family)